MVRNDMHTVSCVSWRVGKEKISGSIQALMGVPCRKYQSGVDL